MKKEKSKGQQEAQAIQVHYEKGRMIFAVGGQEFFLSEESAGRIFGRPVGLEFERLAGADDNFGGLRSLENYVLIRRLLSKGLTLDLIAGVLNRSQEQVRAFYAAERARPHEGRYDINAVENERAAQAKEEMDFCMEARRPRAMNETEDPPVGEKFVDLLQVRSLQKQDMRSEKIASYLGLDEKEFSRFLEKNAKYLALIP